MSSRRTPRTSSASSSSPAGRICCSIPTRSRRSRRSLRLIGHDCAQRRRDQRLVPRDPDRAEDCRAHPAADERERRARQVRARLRQDRRADAVQYVPPLHGGRAPDPRGRRDGRDRERRAARTSCRSPTSCCRTSRTSGCSMWRSSSTTSPRAGPRITPRPVRRIARKFGARLGLGAGRDRDGRRGWSNITC